MPMNDTPFNDAPADKTTTFTIGVGEIVAGTIGSSQDRDWFSVALQAGVQYTFAMVGVGTDLVTTPKIELFDAASVSLGMNDSGFDNNNAMLTLTPIADGTYFIAAASFFAGTYKLSVNNGSKASYDIEMAAGAIDSGSHWTAQPGTGATVTFGFRDFVDGGENADTFRQFGSAQQAAARAMIMETMEISGLVFTDVAPGGYTNNAQILFGNYGNNSGGGYAWYPQIGSSSTNYAGDIWVSADPAVTAVPTGTSKWSVLQHELGHAIGLDHAGNYNGGGVTFAASAEFEQDDIGWTIMSYFANQGPSYHADFLPDGWMLADVIALQNIYGANMTTRTGDTTYGFNGNAGGIFDFTTNSDPFLTIWDAGGTDTLDVSLFAGNQTIDLRGMTYSSVLGLTNTVAIAPGARIENAKAGGGNDVVQGNDLANRLWGNAGSDTLMGNFGNDTLTGGSGGDSLSGGTGSDRLIGLGGGDRMDAGSDNKLDVFVFQSRNDSAANLNRDVLFNFDMGEDIIILRGLDANTDKAGNQKFAGLGGRPGDYGLWAMQRDGSTILFADVTGDGRADFSLKLAGINDLGADSLIL